MKSKIFLAIIAGFLLSSCTKNTDGKIILSNISINQSTITPTMSESEKITSPVTAIIKTNMGTMKVVLEPDWAPNTVQNFVDLAKGTKINPSTGKKVSDKPFYDGVIFHRVIEGFMIQGGDPTGTGRGTPGYRFADEKVTEKYTRGTIAMANAGPNTNGSQFFIMHKDYPLPPSYTIFGRIPADDKESFATLDAIATTPTDPNDAPLDKVIIESVTIE